MRWALMLVIPLLAGCATQQPSPEPEGNTAATAMVPASFENGRIKVDVAVPVVLIGFPEGTAAALHETLEELRPDARTYDGARLLSPNLLNGAGSRANPMDPTAVYHYQESANLTAAVLAGLPALEIEPGRYDAIGVDDLLAASMAAHGVSLPVGASGLVLLHLGSSDHSYRLQYPTGYIDGVRAFGERHGYTVLDVSAQADPYVGTARSFNVPVANDDIDAMAEAVAVHTWYRALQGPLYPQSTAPCHGVTLVVVYRASTLSQTLPGYSRAEDLLDVDFLQQAWESLLGDGRVFVDAKFLALPVDDPPLDAVLRAPSNEPLRAYMDLRWDEYHVDHEGCESYLSVFLIGDVADNDVSGIAMYDVNDDRRLSMSWMNDLTVFSEQDGAAGAVLYQDDPSRNHTDWVNFLFSHETGHLFGQRHPHDVSAQAPSAGMTFAAIWSAMSYQQDGKMPLFGTVDQNNYWRNRAGFLAENADVDAPEFADAMALLGAYKWQDGGDLLLQIQKP